MQRRRKIIYYSSACQRSLWKNNLWRYNFC